MSDILRFKKANCKDCYKCIRNCELKAIEIKDHQAQIIDQECVLCGRCVQVCPQNAKEVRSDVGAVKALMQTGQKVVASVAPSYVAAYGTVSFEDFRQKLMALGFADAFEVAEAAYIVKKEYERLVRERSQPAIISTCCPTAVRIAEKHFPAAIPFLAPVLSPMQAHAKLIKERVPGCKVVFIGPCISKKEECERYPGMADYALTYDELGGWFEERHVDPTAPSEASSGEKYRSRFFPVVGGILKSMDKEPDFRYIEVAGLKNCVAAFEELLSGGLTNCFIEMSACKQSCVGGPLMGKYHAKPLQSNLLVNDVAFTPDAVDYDVEAGFSLQKRFDDEKLDIIPPSEEQIAQILRKMGKKTPEDELNCGTCGYSSCRQKAVAIYFGKADISMCLPYMKERAESLAGKVIGETPNAIITVDASMNIQLINAAACEIFGIGDPHDVMGSPVSRIMDEFEFVTAFANETPVTKQKTYLAEYQKYMDQTIVFDASNNIVICIMRDITGEEKERERLRKTKSEAVEITDKILEKQMRIVHEIASLLGETAAETQIALSELKKTVEIEEDNNL